MTYGVVVIGVAGGAVSTSVAELVGERAVHSGDRRVVITLPDQSALLAVIARLHDLGIEVDHVYRHPDGPVASPDAGAPT